MKKNLKVIQINGLRGLIMAGFIGVCLIAGFVAFPGFLAMNIWNLVATNLIAIPTVGLVQGILLWGITVVTYFIFKKRSYIISFKTPQDITEEELMTMVEKINSQEYNDVVSKAMIRSKEIENLIESENNNENIEIIESDAESAQNSDTNSEIKL